MKLAWLVKDYYGWDDDEDTEWQIVFEEPRKHQYGKVQPIVYAELEDNGR